MSAPDTGQNVYSLTYVYNVENDQLSFIINFIGFCPLFPYATSCILFVCAETDMIFELHS